MVEQRVRMRDHNPPGSAGSDLLPRVAGTLLRLPYEPWRFGDSIAFEAMIRASEVLDDASYAGFGLGFARGWEATRDGYQPLDLTAPGRALVELADRYDDDQALQAARALADYLARRRRLQGVFVTWERSPLRQPHGGQPLGATDQALLEDPGAGVFLDCLHFDPPFFAALATVTGDPDWGQLAVEQAAAYIQLLRDATTGLFHHFYLERTGRCYIPDWGRGQGWALLGLLDVIDSLPAHSGIGPVRAAAIGLAEAMADRQRADGHWEIAVDHPGSGDETSTAAFMATGLARAARLVPDPSRSRRLRDCADRARLATIASIDEAGVLTGVSAAVWASTVESHYHHVPRGFTVAWGQGPALLALSQPAADSDGAA